MSENCDGVQCVTGLCSSVMYFHLFGILSFYGTLIPIRGKTAASWCFRGRGVNACFRGPAWPAKCQQGSNETLVVDVQLGMQCFGIWLSLKFTAQLVVCLGAD